MTEYQLHTQGAGHGLAPAYDGRDPMRNRPLLNGTNTSMMINRYGLGREHTNMVGSPAIVGCADGEYVRHDDHAALITELQAELAGVERIVVAQTVTIAELRVDHSGGANDMVDAPVPPDPVAWCIDYTCPRNCGSVVYHGHNAIADYRDIDPNATSTPLFEQPPTSAQPGHSENALNMVGAPDGALINEGTKAVLPKLPMPIYKHPVLGELYDRLAMHMYAVGHGDQVAAHLGVPTSWTLTYPQIKALAAELVKAAEAMGSEAHDPEYEGEELVLQVRLPGTVSNDDCSLNEQPLLAISLFDYPEEGVYPIDPADCNSTPQPPTSAQLAVSAEPAPNEDAIYLGCARMGLAEASDDEVLSFVRIAKQRASTPTQQEQS